MKTSLYTPSLVEGGTHRVPHLAQEHSSMTLDMDRPWSCFSVTRAEVQSANHHKTSMPKRVKLISNSENSIKEGALHTYSLFPKKNFLHISCCMADNHLVPGPLSVCSWSARGVVGFHRRFQFTLPTKQKLALFITVENSIKLSLFSTLFETFVGLRAA